MKVKKTSFRALLAAVLCAFLTLPAAAQTFADVPRTHWAYANIEEAASDGAVKGYQDGSFAPANPLSLAHFTVILTRSFYGDELDRIPAGASASWYGAAESVARSHGLLTDMEASMNDPLSRYQMAVEIHNFLTARGLTFSQDAVRESAASIRDWNAFPSYGVKNAVACVYSLGILGGYADGKFYGENILNRAQAAAIYCRVKNVLENFAPSLSDDRTPIDDSNNRTPADIPDDWTLDDIPDTPIDIPDVRTPADILDTPIDIPDDWTLDDIPDTPIDIPDDWTLDDIPDTPIDIPDDWSLDDIPDTPINIPDGWSLVDIPDGATPAEILEKLFEKDTQGLENILDNLNDMNVSAPDDSQPETVSDSTQAFREEVLRLVNEARAKEGLGALTLSNKLTQAAQIRADELPDTFSHTRPDGRSCFTVLSEVGVGYMATGENIAAGQRTPADVMNSWMNSSGHRANILSKDYGELGVGVCKAPDSYGVYWVQLFTD